MTEPLLWRLLLPAYASTPQPNRRHPMTQDQNARTRLEDLSDEIQECHCEAIAAAHDERDSDFLYWAVKAGDKLIETMSLAPNCEWTAWLEHFPRTYKGQAPLTHRFVLEYVYVAIMVDKG